MAPKSRTHSLQLLHLNDADAETTEFVLPSDEELAALDDGALAALLEQATGAFDQIRAAVESGDAEAAGENPLATLHALADAVEAIQAVQTERTVAAAAVIAEAAQLAERVHGPADETPPEGEGDETPPADGDTPEPEAPEAPAEPAEDEQAPEAVAAAAPRAARQSRTVRVPALDAIRRQAPDPGVRPAEVRGFSVTAAADLPDIPVGRSLDRAQIATAMHARARYLGEGSRAPIASYHYEASDGAYVDESMTKDQQMEAVRAATEPQGRIVEGRQVRFLEDAEGLPAAGGWCAPSDRRFDLYGIEAADGLLDLPELQIRRGGLEHIAGGGPTIADMLDAPFLWTEAMDIEAGNNPHEDPDDDVFKPCVRVGCPGWTNVRLAAHGLCIKHGNLADAAFPEMTRRYTDLGMSAHAHVYNSREINGIITGSTAVAIANTPGALSAVLGAATLQAQDIRDKYAMAEDAVVEMKIPSWTIGVFQNDNARRLFGANDQVTRASLTRLFADRFISVQFVQDFDRLQLDAGEDGFREVWPADIRFIIYPPGVWLRGVAGRIDLAIGRDSVLNPVNDHTVMFFEEPRLLAKVGPESRVVTVAGTCPDGQAGGKPIVAGDYACPIA